MRGTRRGTSGRSAARERAGTPAARAGPGERGAQRRRRGLGAWAPGGLAAVTEDWAIASASRVQRRRTRAPGASSAACSAGRVAAGRRAAAAAAHACSASSRTAAGRSRSSQPTRLRCSAGSTNSSTSARAPVELRRARGTSSSRRRGRTSPTPVGQQVVVADERAPRAARRALGLQHHVEPGGGAARVGLPGAVGLRGAREDLGGVAQHRHEGRRDAELCRAALSTAAGTSRSAGP